MRRNTIWIGLAGAAALATSVAVGGEMTTATTAGFDGAAWKAQAGNGKPGNPRGGMAKEAEKALRSGMSRQEVEAMLGRPDESYRLHIYGKPAAGAGLHAKAIRFDPNGKVSANNNNITKGVSGAGMTPKQVAAIIGEPAELREDYIYYLGTPPMGLDPVSLHVEFDAEGRLVRHFREQG